MIVIDLISTEQASAPAVLNVKGLKEDCHFTIAVSSEFYAEHALQVVLSSKVNLPHAHLNDIVNCATIDRPAEVNTQSLQVIYCKFSHV